MYFLTNLESYKETTIFAYKNHVEKFKRLVEVAKFFFLVSYISIFAQNSIDIKCVA